MRNENKDKQVMILPFFLYGMQEARASFYHNGLLLTFLREFGK